jgi:hypothetical protein
MWFASITERFFDVIQILTTSTGDAVKSLAQRGRKQATATEDFEFHISYL